MTWQDELRQLDEELAAGRLSAEDYRRQRDELLSQSASTAGPTSRPPGAPGPPQPPQSSGPFPPPFRWDEPATESTQYISPIRDAPANSPGGGDPTQVVPGVAAAGGDDAERTQVVHGRQGQTPGDADRTQVVPGQTPGQTPGQGQPHGPQQQPPIGFPNQQQGQPSQQGYNPSVPPWQQTGSSTPPWVGSDLPPQTDLPPAWLRQGPEAFETTGGSNTGKIVAAVVAVVLVLGLGAGAFFVFRPGSDDNDPAASTSQTTAPTTTAPPTTTSKKPEGPPITDLPGLVVDTDNVKTFDDMDDVDYLTPQETETYRTGGAAATKMAISNDNGARIVILITRQADATAAVRTRDVLADLQLAYGLAALQAGPGVRAGANDAGPSGPLRRAHYASNGYVVRVQVEGPDLASVNTLFTEILGGQLDQMPADAQ